MYHTKKIGVFISHIFGTYQQGVCQGIIDRAMEYGYTAEIFTSLDGENLGSYALGEESILHLPNYDSFEGILFASDTYISQELRCKILDKLQTLSCPIVEISLKDAHFPAVFSGHPVSKRGIGFPPGIADFMWYSPYSSFRGFFMTILNFFSPKDS